MTKEELEQNYKTFTDARIAQLANEPEGLSELALEVLYSEIAQRKLDVEVNFQSNDESAFQEEFRIQIFSNEDTAHEYNAEMDAISQSMFPTALKVFTISPFSLAKLGLAFLVICIFFIYASLNLLELDNVFGKIFLGLGILFGLLTFWVFKSSNKDQLVVYEETIRFQSRSFVPGSKGTIFDLLRLVFFKHRIELPKSQIAAIKRPEGFFRLSFLHLELIDGKRIEINFIADKEELEEMYQYVSRYLNQKNITTAKM